MAFRPATENRSGALMNSHSFPTDYATLSRTQIGSSRALCRVFDDIRMVSPLESAVLIQGETGTGKELTARAIHEHGSRRNGPFIAINCAAIPMSLLESELFGYEKGAFTGAVRQTSGKFLAAHQGTLFLDEIGDMPLELQPKLLRALEEQQYHPLGGTRIVRMDVRIISASNLDLQKKVEENRFRADLFYRLAVFPIHLPALRDRKDDIPCLVHHFVQELGHKIGRSVQHVPPEILEIMCQYYWPGNIRELKNFVERSLITSPGNALTPRPGELEALMSAKNTAPNTLCDVERAHIVRILKDTNWKLSGMDGAAARLGMPRTTLISRMHKLGLSRPPAMVPNAVG